MMNFKGIIYSLKEPFTKKPRVCVGGGGCRNLDKLG